MCVESICEARPIDPMATPAPNADAGISNHNSSRSIPMNGLDATSINALNPTTAVLATVKGKEHNS